MDKILYLGQLTPESKNVMTQVSRGMYTRNREPDATNSTTPCK